MTNALTQTLDRVIAFPVDWYLDKQQGVNGFLYGSYHPPAIVSIHPRTRKRVEVMGVQLDSLVQLLKPLGL